MRSLPTAGVLTALVGIVVSGCATGGSAPQPGSAPPPASAPAAAATPGAVDVVGLVGGTSLVMALATLQAGGGYGLYRINLLTGRAEAMGPLTEQVTDIAVPLGQA